MRTSVSDNTSYPSACLQAANDPAKFELFRSIPEYTMVLEHVTPELGGKYLDLILEDEELISYIPDFKRNDQYGSPLLSNYPEIGTISPTTLRYIKVLKDLKDLFGSLSSMDICEIGVGYGGQCRILNSYFIPWSYKLVDILPALALTERFLYNFHPIESLISYETMEDLRNDNYDLVISNYAFTELCKEVQDVYLDKIVLRSKRGYMTYNNINPPEIKSYTLDDLLNMIPNSRVIPETPLTHPDNCVIIWDQTNSINT